MAPLKSVAFNANLLLVWFIDSSMPLAGELIALLGVETCDSTTEVLWLVTLPGTALTSRVAVLTLALLILIYS